MARGDAQIRLRIPHRLRERVIVAAKRNLRTMNSEIVMILANALGDESKPATGESLQAKAPAAGPNETALAGGPITHG